MILIADSLRRNGVVSFIIISKKPQFIENPREISWEMY